jgi:hypothetical protein
MMALGALVAAVVVSIVLDCQERQHRLEESLEYEYLGWEKPMPKLKPRGEAGQSIIVGAILLTIGSAGLYAIVILEQVGEAIGGQYIVAAFLAGGVALIVVGWRALRDIREHGKREAA